MTFILTNPVKYPVESQNSPVDTGDNLWSILYDLQEKPLEVHNHFDDPDYRDIREEFTRDILQHLLSHSRYRSFGGGKHGSDPERIEKFKEIQAKIANGEYPGLD